MKGKTTYQFKKILFQSSRIDIAGGWHVGNKADNPACRYPKRGTDRDLIYNHSAITLENLMSGKLKAALLNMEDGTQILYFQYQSSTNGQIQAVVIPECPMRIEVDRDVDDHYASYLAVQFMSACYFLISPDASPYGNIREGMKDVQDMARQICGAKTDTPNDMARISDIMYYGIAKAGDPESTIAFSMTFAEQAAQMMRSASSIETPDLSEEIEGLAATKQSEKKNKSTNELLSCSLDEFSRKVKDGRLLIGYSWNEVQKQMIPDIDSIWDSYECSESERRMIVRVFMSLQAVHMTGGGVGFSRRQDKTAEVQINFNRDYFGNGKFEENIPIYWGINAHEMMHILITDFDYERKELEKIASRLERKERHNIANIVEDPAIEHFSPEYLPAFMVHCAGCFVSERSITVRTSVPHT